MSEQEELPDLIKAVSVFCKVYNKHDKNLYVITHPGLRHIRHTISLHPDDNVMVSNDRENYKIRMSKDKFMDYFHDELNKALQKNIDTVIHNIERYHIGNTNIKVKPFGMTKTKVKQLSVVNGAMTNGMCSVKLNVSVYDNWLLFKKVKQTNDVIIGFAKDEIYVTVCYVKKETYGICEDMSNVDGLVSELIAIQNKEVVDL